MLIRQLWPWPTIVPVPVLNSCRPRILPRTLPRTLPRLPICAKRFSHHERLVVCSQASVLFASSRHATPDNLIASIEPISPRSSIEGLEDSYGQAILLFTPSFAQSLAYDPQFLSTVLNRLLEKLPDFYTHGPGSKSLQVAVAVVDRLPRRSARSGLKPTMSDHGSEGLSYLVSAIPELDVTGDTDALTRSNVDETKTLSVLIGDAQGSRVIETQESETSTVPANTENDEVSKKYKIEVQVPLASTVFQTGQPSMLSLSSWAWNNAGHRFILEQKSTESPSHVSFKFPFLYASVVTMPLIPLTPPRKIIAGMGNVIRQIERDTEHITASQELEPAVSSYFIAKDVPPSAVNVWALVIPENLYLELESEIHTEKHYEWLRMGLNSKSAQDLHEIWQRAFAFAPHRWFDLLHRGARLHRVLSGGGGWGKKAGLISLDPDSEFRNASSAELGGALADSDLFETQEGMLGNAAKVGDLVQFYICPSNTTAHSPPNLNADLPPKLKQGMRLEIGTIPSTIDTMPFAEELKDGEGALPLGSVQRDLFGLLSEKGVSFANLNLDADQSWSTPSPTKISVPFSRILCRGSTRDQLFTSLQGKIMPIDSKRLSSKSNKISLCDSHQSGPIAQLTYKTRQRRKWRKILQNLRWHNQAPKPSDPEEQLRQAIQSVQTVIGRIQTMQICKSITWQTRLGHLNAQLRGLRKGTTANLTDTHPIIAIPAVPDSTSPTRQRKIIRGIIFNRFRNRMVPSRVKEMWALRTSLKFPNLHLQDIRHLLFRYGGRNPKLDTILPAVDPPCGAQPLLIRKHLSTSRQERTLRDFQRAHRKSKNYKPVMIFNFPARVVSESSRVSWTSLQRRRARGNMGVKMRSRYEEGLETALVRKHPAVDAPAVKREPRVETAEMKAKRMEDEEREKEELLDTVKKLLKGF